MTENTCPTCNALITNEYLNPIYAAQDYPATLETTCPNCKAPITVEISLTATILQPETQPSTPTSTTRTPKRA